jgi:hypothetical protein
MTFDALPSAATAPHATRYCTSPCTRRVRPGPVPVPPLAYVVQHRNGPIAPTLGMRRAFIFITHLLSPHRSSVQVIHEDRCSNAHDPSVGNSHTCGLNGNAVGKRARVHECTAVVNEVSTKYPRMTFLTLLGAQGELDPQQRPRVAK